MPAYRVNEALACHWISKEISIQKTSSIGFKSLKAIEKFKKIKARPKPKFNF